jgi:hypothetical protein
MFTPSCISADPTCKTVFPLYVTLHNLINKALLSNDIYTFSATFLLYCTDLSVLMHILAKCRLSWKIGLISTEKQARELISDPSSAAKTRLLSFNLLKPSGFFTYRQVWHSEILNGARFALSVLYGSQNRQRPLLYTSLTDWFLEPWWEVFTARYGLIPYTKQNTFRTVKVNRMHCRVVTSLRTYTTHWEDIYT